MFKNEFRHELEKFKDDGLKEVGNIKFFCKKCNNFIYYYKALDGGKYSESDFFWKFNNGYGNEWERLSLTCEEEQIKKLLE